MNEGRVQAKYIGYEMVVKVNVIANGARVPLLMFFSNETANKGNDNL
jgi:hypothetical protein